MLTAVVVLLFTHLAMAQTVPPASVRSLTIDDGLPQGLVTAIVQDRAGFIWLGTNDGLARYDGRSIHTLVYDPADDRTLSSNVITGLTATRDDKIWVNHENGATDILDAVTGEVQRLAKQPAFAFLARRSVLTRTQQVALADGTICIGFQKSKEGGLSLYLYHPGRHTLATVAFPGGDQPWFYAGDSTGALWVCSARYLYRMLPGGRLTRLARLPARELSPEQREEERFPGNGTMQLMGDGRLLLCAVYRLWIYDPRDGRWTPFNLPPGLPETASKRLFAGRGGTLFLAGDGKMYEVDAGGNCQLLWVNDTRANPVSAFADRTGVLWIGTNTFGARMLNRQTPGFRSFPYQHHFFYDLLPRLMGVRVNGRYHDAFANEDYSGHSKFDKQRTLWLKGFIYDSIGGNALTANSLVQLREGRVYTYDVPLPDSVETRVVDFAFDEQNRCWLMIPVGRTLALFDPLTRKIQRRISLPAHHYFANFLLSVGAELCVVYPDGLYFINPDTGVGSWYRDRPGVSLFASAYLLMATPDPVLPHVLWVSSRGNGLIRLDRQKGTATSFTTRNGLPNNTVYCIVPDKKGLLWCSSNKGIFRFDPRSASVLSFTARDGLQGNEFNRFYYLQLPDGRIAFGGTQGYTVFHPDSIRIDRYQPPVVLTDIKVNNQPLKQYSGRAATAIAAVDSLRLRHHQNFLTFQFAALQFNQPEQLRYRYQLRGVDGGWVDAGTQQTVNYTALSPGNYTLLVNATNTAGRWSNLVRSVHIAIDPPWWGTWWALTLYCVAAAGVLSLLFRERLRRARVRQEMELRQREAARLKEIDALKSRFFSNITHEFRTPLTLIITPVAQMQQDPLLPEPVRRQLDVVQRNARQLLRLINQLLDMNKLEHGNMSISLARGPLELFFGDLVHSFRGAARDKGVAFSYEAAVPAIDFLFDPDKWEKIGYNLLSNALKFTPAGGSIAVSLAVHTADGRQLLHFGVSDTGIGIPAEQITAVFDRFYQADNTATRRFEGTGIGLALVRELVELMGGTVTAQSRPGEGSSFLVVVPVQPAGDTAAPEWVRTPVGCEVPLPAPGANTWVEPEATAPLVLVVDDNEALRSFLADNLSRRYRVLTATNGAEALRVAAGELPDIVISDVMMPKMDGFELCGRLKSAAATEHIAVILLTAKAAHEHVVHGLGAGADDYLVKPFHFDELQLRIGNLLERQEKLRTRFGARWRQPDAAAAETGHPFVQQLYQYIDEHINDHSLNVEQLAASAAVSSRTLNRKLAAITGLSANELIRQYRLKKSVALLRSGYNVSETAYRVGFDTHAYFTTSFKHFFGFTPTEFLQEQKRN